MEAASSWSVSWWNVMRGWLGFGWTFSSGSSRTAVGVRAASRLMIPGWESLSCAKIRLPASRKDLVFGRSLVSTDDLPCEIDERLRGVRLPVVFGDRHACGGCLADLHGLADDGVEDLVIPDLLERVEHVASEDRAAVIEGREHAEHFHVRVQAALDRLDDPPQRSHPL